LSSARDVDALVEEACRRFGHIDIMVANAAIPGGARAEDETEQGWDQGADS
jgi:NAD(P)-dependent dehydrogenase (short-subunit alcohol dehydrogenase family)